MTQIEENNVLILKKSLKLVKRLIISQMNGTFIDMCPVTTLSKNNQLQ
ncbi:hypothetical protein HDF25_000809 [Pedobacter cryoconitis]|uniref:Uncharacterized protein n=1 Tax=Pedobacter cryoconitis TaxID=188932 RepID=A0A7X0J2N6_9SPHI|nr:hypothetical protein [Pedobacter cryoconitis]